MVSSHRVNIFLSLFFFSKQKQIFRSVLKNKFAWYFFYNVKVTEHIVQVKFFTILIRNLLNLLRNLLAVVAHFNLGQKL